MVLYDVFGLTEPLNVDLQVSTDTAETCTPEGTATLNQLLCLGITPDTTPHTPVPKATSTVSVPPNTIDAGVSSVSSVNMPEEQETAAFFRLLDLLPTSSNLEKSQDVPEPPMPSLPI